MFAFYAINLATTVVSFSGAGYTEIGSGVQTSSGLLLTRTIRYKEDAAGLQTSGAQFAASDLDIGGLLMEISGCSRIDHR